ncbi:hypothetical protein BDR04DRAFT_1149641 [Suillus decipiens]|nr:hypothetical protein BDR04DRAFT_1149641 [Suillus decipiens]
MRGKLLTMPTIPCPREPSCLTVFSHSTGDAELLLNKPDGTTQILNYANFEIATALMSPTRFRRIITSPVYNGMEELPMQTMCAAAVLLRKAWQVTREQALADPSALQILLPVAQQAVSMPSADPTFHLVADISAGVSTLMSQNRCGWSQAIDLCDDVVSADTLVTHMRKHVRGSSHRRVCCSWNGCGKVMRKDCLVRHIREVHLHGKRRAHD